jgi:hypothetical protein
MLRLAGASVLAVVTGGLMTGCGSDTSAGVFIPATAVPTEVRRVAEPPPTPTPVAELDRR